VAFQVNGNVDAAFMQEARNGKIAHSGDILKMVETLDQPLTHGACVILAKGNGSQLKLAAVVLLEEAGGELGGGVLAKIGGQIGDANWRGR
jgi:hypothetical protein